jgi:hypothetical protein
LLKRGQQKQVLLVNENKTQDLVVTDIRPFMSMVFFMVKWVVAAIPAMFILTMLEGAYYWCSQ